MNTSMLTGCRKITSVALIGLIVFGLMTPAVFAATGGPVTAGTAIDVSGVGTKTWGTTSNITTDGSPYSNVTLAFGETSHYLQASNYGLTIPAGATINGITVQVRRNGSANTLGLGVRDNIVSLIKGGNIIGNNKAITGSTWGTTFNTITYGGVSDLWGTTWTPSDINAGNFGVVFSATTNAVFNRTATVDYIKISVDYTPDTTAPVISQVTSVPTPSTDSTPSYTFTTDEAGTISYGGSCASPMTAATAGSNTITFNTLIDGTYSDCTITVTDVATNVSNTLSVNSFTIDTTAPVITLPSDITEEATAPAGNAITFSVSASDTDPISPSVSCDEISGDTFPIGVTTVTCSATDTVGNTASDIFTITIEDTTDPVLTTPETITFEATGSLTPATLIGATSTDIGDASPTITYNPTTLPLGQTSVTVTATDDAGNDTSLTTIATVVDTTAPVILLSGNNPYDLYINGTFTDPGFLALDIVDGVLTGSVVVSGSGFDTGVLGAHTITYSVEDAQGNSTSTTRTVNVVNNIKPIIYKLGTSPVTHERLAPYIDAGATATDRDGSDITSSIVVTGWDYNTSSLGTFEIFYNVTGAELGDLTGTSVADQATRTIQVVDTTAPTATVGYSTIAPTNANVIATITPSEDITVTNNGGLLSYTFTDNGTFTFTFIDGSGNTGSALATVENIDRENPEIVQIGDDDSIQAVSPETIEVVFDSQLQNNGDHMPSESDFIVYNDVDDSGSRNAGDIDYDIASVSYSDTTYTVSITLTDALQSGDNPRLFITSSMTSLVDLAGNYYNNGSSSDHPVLDEIAPVITLSGSSSVTLTRGSAYTDAGATCVDVVDEMCTVVTSGTVNTGTAGTYLLTYSASDSSGNISETLTRTVTVSSPGGGSVILPQSYEPLAPSTPSNPENEAPTQPTNNPTNQPGDTNTPPSNPSDSGETPGETPSSDNEENQTSPPSTGSGQNSSGNNPSSRPSNRTNSNNSSTGSSTPSTNSIQDSQEDSNTEEVLPIPPAVEEISDVEKDQATDDMGGGQPADDDKNTIAWFILGLLALLNIWWFAASRWKSNKGQ